MNNTILNSLIIFLIFKIVISLINFIIHFSIMFSAFYRLLVDMSYSLFFTYILNPVELSGYCLALHKLQRTESD